MLTKKQLFENLKNEITFFKNDELRSLEVYVCDCENYNELKLVITEEMNKLTCLLTQRDGFPKYYQGERFFHSAATYRVMISQLEKIAEYMNYEFYSVNGFTYIRSK